MTARLGPLQITWNWCWLARWEWHVALGLFHWDEQWTVHLLIGDVTVWRRP